MMGMGGAMSLDPAALLIGFCIGLPAGLLFFLGLHRGLRWALERPRPGLALLLSFLVRAALLLGLVYGLTRIVQPLGALLGFVPAFLLARLYSVRWARRGDS